MRQIEIGVVEAWGRSDISHVEEEDGMGRHREDDADDETDRRENRDRIKTPHRHRGLERGLEARDSCIRILSGLRQPVGRALCTEKSLWGTVEILLLRYGI